jgi:hypothetical protein
MVIWDFVIWDTNDETTAQQIVIQLRNQYSLAAAAIEPL